MTCDQKNAIAVEARELHVGTERKERKPGQQQWVSVSTRGIPAPVGVRMSRVVQLRNRIANGTYRVSSNDLAGAMMRRAHPKVG